VERDVSRLIDENDALKKALGNPGSVSRAGGQSELAQLRTELEQLDAKRVEARRLLDQLQQKLRRHHSSVEPFSAGSDANDPGSRVLRIARIAADACVREAREESEALVNAARVEAEGIVTRAEIAASTTVSDARYRHTQSVDSLPIVHAAAAGGVEELRHLADQTRGQIADDLNLRLRKALGP
jgi:cell division septum initiation protein DivIVA